MEVLSAFGGEMIFTPGDIVYSSSKVIEAEPPSLQLEKLLTLMDMARLSFDSLRRSLDGFAGKRVHVIGDTIVDSLTECAMIGGQTKTPTLSVLFQEKKDFIGGAGIVAQHISAAGADVVFSTVLGDDPYKKFVLQGLKKAGVQVKAIVDPTRPTNNKNAIVAGGYRLLKVDTLDNRSITDDICAQLSTALRETSTDAIVFSDFRHGIFNRRTIPELMAAIPAGVFKVADSQVASRWGNITDFKDFDLVTPNEREARFALADQDSGVRALADLICDRAASKTVMLKMGDRGVLTRRQASGDDAASLFFVVDSFVDRVVDAVGAGDALLAYATLTLMTTGCPVTATIIGSLAAAVECESDGNRPVGPGDVRMRIDAVERRSRYER
jgi:bifunctional ADP-heptose synthase (sugar kinase/adenylyltransferase)